MARRSGPLTPTDAVAVLSATARRRWKTWLVGSGAAGGLDGATDGEADGAVVDLPMHPPTGKAAAEDVNAASAWIRTWQAWATAHPQATVVWVEKSWGAAGLGRQQVPDRLQVTGVDDLVAITGQRAEWRGLLRRFTTLVGDSPSESVRSTAAAVMSRWRDLSEEDLHRVHTVVNWFLAHPDSGLTPRAVPVEGVHGKWLESHLTLVTRLVAARRGEAARAANADDAGETNTTQPEVDQSEAGTERGTPRSSLEYLGLVDKEPQVRLRLPSGLPGWESLPEDITLTWSGAASLWTDPASPVPVPMPVTGVLMVENLETFLALPSRPGRVLLWGAGYSARKWAQLPWLADLPVWYWGDLDADGYGILSAVRSHLPQAESVLMDEAAVRRWSHLATEDAHPDRKNLAHLTASEDAARDLLVSLGNLRIEQERILLADAVDAVTEAGY